MAHYRIFIPNAQSETPSAALARVGLGGLLFADDWPIGHGQIAGGPDGMRGLCVSWEPTLQRPGVQAPRYEFSPEHDIALRAPAEPALQLAEGRFWLLLEPGRPVTPEDLKRKPRAEHLAGAIASGHDAPEVIRDKTERLKALTFFAGGNVTLGDGRSWTIPKLTELPCVIKYQPATSTFGREIDGQYQAIYARMLEMFNRCKQHLWFELFRDHTPEQLALIRDDDMPTSTPPRLDDYADGWPFVAEILALNYRLTPWIMDQLGLLKDSVLWECLATATNYRELVALSLDLQKKTALIQQLGSTINSGNKASSNANPPSPTSG